MKLTVAQILALQKVERRDWPAGEPRRSWINKATLSVLERLGLVEEHFPDILHLTDAGRQDLKGGE
ncbi:hypothetical protein DKP76_07380 [Falsochrobactrum shanghaiense]|uniref:MarR family transcriptional regulator n=1 Tax=Falsochrobactrum shanghaiense TaxID=2201899 RepID=A0A316JBP7_9HYPH|nr:hypothetical protein DKP76_07380 [Falsochrobactrum shanghaiense]